MSWRFRQSFTLIPGVRLNLSKSGLSASIGGAPFTLNVGSRGVNGTASLPGTGISYRRHFSSPTTSSAEPAIPHVEFVRAPPAQEIHSASTESLTSQSLQELKQLIQTTQRQREEIGSELALAEVEKGRLSKTYASWENGFLLKRLFKKEFAKRKFDAEASAAKVQELEEQLRVTVIATHFEIHEEQAELYFRMRDEFAKLSSSAAIWGLTRQQSTDRFRERTTADSRLERKQISFSLGSCDLIQWEQRVPHLRSANDGDIYLYPGFIIYRVTSEAFSLISSPDLKVNATLVGFREDEAVPADSRVVGQSWVKENKDGSRDRRFAHNYQIPVVQLVGCR